MPITAMIVSFVAGAALAIMVVRLRAGRHATERLAAARAEAAALVSRGRIEGIAARRAAESRAREAGLQRRTTAEQELASGRAELERRTEKAARTLAESEARHAELDIEHGVIDERIEAINRTRDRAKGLFQDAENRGEQLLARLEERSSRSAAELRDALAQRWVEEARASAAARIRQVEQSMGDAAHDEAARRLMEISVARYRNHFLTERSISKLTLAPGLAELLTGNDGLIHRTLEQVSNVQLHIDESGEFLRLEGLDGVGREVARRAINRLGKKAEHRDKAAANPETWSTKIRENLEREIVSLGKRAFSVLRIERAHPEIVQLVGALNYRTSYTQNQWLHAVEASFLAGIMAEELGLDLKLARRATLMHDIGKALTHVIEGSHAVIGADIARRLGEEEVVANAIGAHHLDEPMSSAYAFLVAAADAMSGARPGARREFEGGYSTRLADLERIGQSFRGVDRAYAVHGGRELRVYVREGQISDLEAVELSADIADQVSDEMTFPGQIKVTVIRAYEAVATAN